MAVAGFNAGTGPVRASRDAAPVPVTVAGVPPLTVVPAWKVSVPLATPTAVGVNVTLKVQVAPTAMVVPQVPSNRVNGAATVGRFKVTLLVLVMLKS